MGIEFAPGVLTVKCGKVHVGVMDFSVQDHFVVLRGGTREDPVCIAVADPIGNPPVHTLDPQPGLFLSSMLVLVAVRLLFLGEVKRWEYSVITLQVKGGMVAAHLDQVSTIGVECLHAVDHEFGRAVRAAAEVVRMRTPAGVLA